MTKEDTIIFIVFVMVLIVGYNLFKAFWNNKPLVEGLANMSLAGNSKAVVESIKSKNNNVNLLSDSQWYARAWIMDLNTANELELNNTAIEPSDVGYID